MKILIVQLRRVGDILLTTPVLSYVKQVYPGATVHFLAEPMGKTVLETNPHLDRLILYDKNTSAAMIRLVRAEKYDLLFDFMNNPRSGWLSLFSGARHRVGWRHPMRRFFYNTTVEVPAQPEYVPLRKLRMVRTYLERTGQPVPAPRRIRPQIFLTHADEEGAERWMAAEGLEKNDFVVMVPVPRQPLRKWRAEGFRRVAEDVITKAKKRVYFAWGPGEESQVAEVRRGMEDQIGLLPLTSFREMAAIFKQAALVLTNESGSMHTAVSVDTPTVTLYGPTRPVDWNPSLAGAGPFDVALTAPEVPCLGCHLNTGCPVGHLCMVKLSEDQVWTACEKLLSLKERV